jgi:hypothetical protein
VRRRIAGRRKAVIAGIVGLLGGALIALPVTRATAEAVEVDLNYVCTGGVAPSSGVNLKVTMTLQTALQVGQPLDIKWGIAYKDLSRFLSPGLFQPGAQVSATGVVGVGGLWSGELESVGSRAQELLPSGGSLALPELISGMVTTTASGVISITPRRLYVDFTPPPGEKVLNDDDPSVTYDSNWADFNDRPAQNHDIHEDVHATQVNGARVDFPFTGTGVDFISEQDARAGEVQFFVDGNPGIPAKADASKDENGDPVVVQNQGNHTLWGMRGLLYGPHTLSIIKTDDKWAMVDGFRVVTEEIAEPPVQFRSTCQPVPAPAAIRVVVGGTAGSPSPDPSGSNPGSGSPSPGTGSPSPSATTTTGTDDDDDDDNLTTVVVYGTPTPTVTITLSPAPSSPQVKVTPVGGAHTGEAPETVETVPSAALLGSGGAMLFVGVFSGLALLRRRAAHAGQPED